LKAERSIASPLVVVVKVTGVWVTEAYEGAAGKGLEHFCPGDKVETLKVQY